MRRSRSAFRTAPSSGQVHIARIDVATASETGRSHVLRGQQSDDAVGWACRDGEPVLATVAVADGHSDRRCFRSRSGASFVIDAARALPTDIADYPAVVAALVDGWRRRVDDDLARNPFTTAEIDGSGDAAGGGSPDALAAKMRLAYGTTALVSRITGDGIVIMQVGDGDVIAVQADGRASTPVPPAAIASSGWTQSMSQDDAELIARSVQVAAEDAPELLMLASDGFDNAYPSEDSMLRAATELWELHRSADARRIAELLAQWACQAAATSGDDATVAAVWIETADGRGSHANG